MNFVLLLGVLCHIVLCDDLGSLLNLEEADDFHGKAKLQGDDFNDAGPRLKSTKRKTVVLHSLCLCLFFTRFQAEIHDFLELRNVDGEKEIHKILEDVPLEGKSDQEVLNSNNKSALSYAYF